MIKATCLTGGFLYYILFILLVNIGKLKNRSSIIETAVVKRKQACKPGSVPPSGITVYTFHHWSSNHLSRLNITE